MFIDYVALLLVNMAAAYFLLAGYVYRGIENPDQRRWALGLGIVGIVALLFGTVMAVTWPLPGAFNTAFGDMSVFLGVILLAAAVALAKGWDLTIIAVYAFFAGVAAILLGVRIIDLSLTRVPALSGIGFILSGTAGVFAAPTLVYLRNNRPFRMLAAIVLVAAGLAWAATAYPAYWDHMEGFSGWVPLTMRGGPGR